MEEVVEMAEFTRESSLTEPDVLNVLNGTWDAGESGYFKFDDMEIKWYQDSSMDENNVFHIEILDAGGIIHPYLLNRLE